MNELLKKNEKGEEKIEKERFIHVSTHPIHALHPLKLLLLLLVRMIMIVMISVVNTSTLKVAGE